MNILSKIMGLLSAGQPTPNLGDKQAVIVHFNYLGGDDLSPLFQLEDQLESVINDNNVGELDGNEMATDGNDGTLYMYGPDADKLLEVVSPILKGSEILKNVSITLMYGPPVDGVREKVITW